MDSPNAKKRTLSEQKESDVAPKKGGSADEKQNEPENPGEEINTYETLKAYIEAKAKKNGKEGVSYLLNDEYMALNDEWSEKHPESIIPMDVVLNRVHGILVPESTKNEAERIVGSIDSAWDEQENEEENEEDEEEEDKRAIKTSKKIQECLQNELNSIKSAWNAKEYQKVFDLLFAVTYEGCIQNQWYNNMNDDKSKIEEMLQAISDAWTQLLTKADKEFCQDHLTSSDKHFISAMMDVLKKHTDENGYKWTFHKPKFPNPEPLEWPTEQKKYEVNVVLLSDDDEVEDSDNQSNSDNQEEDNENENENEDGSGADENGGTEPPAKKKKN